MEFADARNDLAFKKLFGDITHKNILISFLNNVLERTEGKLIIDVVINDPANLPETSSLKYSIVDIRCTEQGGNQYIIEMQVADEQNYAIRAQYYSSLALSRQLGLGEELEAYYRYQNYMWAHLGQMETALNKGKAEGLIEGKLEVAKQLLDILDIETIAQKTGLSIEQVKNLKK